MQFKHAMAAVVINLAGACCRVTDFKTEPSVFL